MNNKSIQKPVDAFGNELALGDKVVYTNMYYSELKKGTIIKLNNVRHLVQNHANMCTSQVNGRSMMKL